MIGYGAHILILPWTLVLLLTSFTLFVRSLAASPSLSVTLLRFSWQSRYAAATSLQLLTMT